MKKRKILSVLISLTLAMTCLCGCGSTATSGPVNSGSNGEMDKSPITLTFFNCDATEDMPFDDDVAKKITELTGVTLKITHPVAGDTQSIPLMIASGDYPDLIFAKGDTGKLIDAGAIIPLDDYIEKEGTNLKNLYGNQIKRLRASKDDPHIYTAGTNGVDNKIYDPNGTMQIQHAVLKELGYPEISTLKDYENAIRQYKEKYPEINGQKTIGMSLMASDWRWLITCGNIASSVAGIPDDGQFKVDDDTETAVYKYQLPELKEYFKWLCHMNAEGLLDPESFTQKEDAYKAKLAQGIVLGISDAKWDYSTVTTGLIGSGMEERTFAPLAVTLDENCKDQSMKNYGYGGGWGVAISSTSEHQERAFQFLDWLASDEAQVLLNWGIEGKHYTVENGVRTVIPEVQQQKNTDKDFAKKTGIGRYVYPFPQRGTGAKDSTGNYYTSNNLETYIANYNKAEKETLAAYGKESWCDMFPAAEELGGSKHGQAWEYTVPSDSDIAIIQKKADDYVQKAITQAILGSEDDFDGAWDKIQSDLILFGIDKVNDGMSQLTKERIELWN